MIKILRCAPFRMVPNQNDCAGFDRKGSPFRVFRNIRNVRSMYRLSHLSQHFLSFANALLRIRMLGKMDGAITFTSKVLRNRRFRTQETSNSII